MSSPLLWLLCPFQTRAVVPQPPPPNPLAPVLWFLIKRPPAPASSDNGHTSVAGSILPPHVTLWKLRIRSVLYQELAFYIKMGVWFQVPRNLSSDSCVLSLLLPQCHLPPLHPSGLAAIKGDVAGTANPCSGQDHCAFHQSCVLGQGGSFSVGT